VRGIILEAPTVEELQQFTYDSYIKLLKYLKNQYKIVPVCKASYEDTPYLILRHDVDVSLQAALKMAKIENSLDIKSTYFILLCSPFYNVLEGDGIAILRQISNMGHEIGLHYYPPQYAIYQKTPEKSIQLETKILEELLNKKIHSIARHGPWVRDPFSNTKKFINANHPYLRADLFIHESNRAWVTLDGLSFLFKNNPEKVQLLIHPDNWQEQPTSREKLLEQHIQKVQDKILIAQQNLVNNFKTDHYVTEYDTTVGTYNYKQLNNKFTIENQSNDKKLAIIKYSLLHTKIGYKLHKLKDQFLTRTKPVFALTTSKTEPIKTPLVSIIITSYNYCHYLNEAIESALKQTYPNKEIIVIDDGSTDKTKEISMQYPVNYFFQSNQGIASARNKGISLTKGVFFLSLDGDDKLFPHCIEETVKQILKNPSTGFIYTGSKIWNEEEKFENIWMPKRILSKYSLFAGWHGSLGPVLIRRKAFESLERGYDSLFSTHEDLDLCFRLLKKGWKADVCYAPLHWYRVHKNSLDPRTVEKKQISNNFLDNIFRFRYIYRITYYFYNNTLGKTEFLMRYGKAYLKGITLKALISLRINLYTNKNTEFREKAEKLQKELQFTIDMLTEWHNDSALKKYYDERLRFLEYKLQNLFFK
jgi:glycosyltransferase involved in cell wall biosynthesis